ncbi:hypothetical protein KBC55_02150 [Patescibacteria group bacterium]|nr:hypothetical protein [Patescibacteria group bacterium]
MISAELRSETHRCLELFNSKVLIGESLFAESVFIELMIRLDYVLQWLSRQGSRFAWGDDVDGGRDITDLVNELRNSVCHQASSLNIIDGTSIKFMFNRFFRRSPRAISLPDGQFLGCEYDDDVAFYYGSNRIYLYRHVERLLLELSRL